MIAANHMKHIEALRFQREMFFNGYKNQPRFMRLMQCIFDQVPSAPNWWKAAKAQARALAKSVEKSILPMFDGRGNVEWTFRKITELSEVPLINQGELSRVKRKGVASLAEFTDMTPNELKMAGRMTFDRALAILTRTRLMFWQ